MAREVTQTAQAQDLDGPAGRTPEDGLQAALSRAATAVNGILERLLPAAEGVHGRVQAAMRYAVFVGGKRLRPFLVLEGSRLFGVPEARALRAAAAIEALHTYSLVHDDLPCMDDDDLRRGQPTTHRKFDEATAVLAGDALLTFAFEVLAGRETHPSGEVRCELSARLAQAGGSRGMIGGQMMDILAPEHRFAADDVRLLQRMKTGALFEFACEAGPILGEAGVDDRRRLRDYAHDFGLAFQISDDLLDVVGTAEQAGKAVGKDHDQGKATLVSILGPEGARREALRLAHRAADVLEPYGDEAEALRQAPFMLIDRQA